MTPKLFIISTVEAIEVAKDIQLGLEHSDVEVKIWNDPSHFTPGQYTLETLGIAIKDYDFGLAIMSGDDIVISRGTESTATRDNVIFELGLFMGSLGRSRTLLAIPRNMETKLASDLQGLTSLNYKIDSSNVIDTTTLVTRLSRTIQNLGVR
ncbi:MULTISPECIES: TIR domain-containing protein [Psychrobacter]|uniref:TIR domain-containing protein n=1 Tax=Psychrobacter TaxID=497 RepID=UPI003FD66E45